MKKEAWKELVLGSVEDFKNDKPETLEMLAHYLEEVDYAKQELRNKGYGWTGLSILETIKTEVPTA